MNTVALGVLLGSFWDSWGVLGFRRALEYNVPDRQTFTFLGLLSEPKKSKLFDMSLCSRSRHGLSDHSDVTSNVATCKMISRLNVS